MLLGVERVEQRGPGAADVQHAGGGGGKTRSDSHLASVSFLVEPEGLRLEGTRSWTRFLPRLALGQTEAATFLFALCFAAGAASSLIWPGTLGLPAAPLLAAALWTLHWGQNRSPSYALHLATLLAAAIASGIAAGEWRAHAASAPVYSGSADPVMLEGWVTGIDAGQSGARLRIAVHAIEGIERSATPEEVRLTHRSRLVVVPGRFVRCWSVLRPPPQPSLPGGYDFARRAWFEQLGAVGYVQGRCRGGTLGEPEGWGERAAAQLRRIQQRLSAHVYERSETQAAAVAAALVSGDRRHIEQETNEALRGAGLGHLLAISGLHMGMLTLLVYQILLRSLALIPPLALRIYVAKPAAVGALIAGFAYLMISGGSVSTQRAFIMACVFFGAVIFDRDAFTFRSFSIALIAVTAIHPQSVVEPGFQMSFAATGALVVAYGAWSAARRNDPLRGMGQDRIARGVQWVQSLLVSSLVASAATAPFALYHFGQVAPWSVVANLVAMPVVSFVVAPAAIAAGLLAPFGWDAPALGAMEAGLRWVIATAHLFSDGGPSDTGLRLPPAALLCFVGGMAGSALVQGGWRLASVAAGTLSAALVWWAAPVAAVQLTADGWLYWKSASGWQSAKLQDTSALPPLSLKDVPLTECSGRICGKLSDGTPIVTGLACLAGEVWVGMGAVPLSCRNGRSLSLGPEDSGVVLAETRGRGWRTLRQPVCGKARWRLCEDQDAF